MKFAEFYETIEPKSDKGTLHDYIDAYYSTYNRTYQLLTIVV